MNEIDFYNEIITKLGGTLVDVEVEYDDMEIFFKRAKRRFQQRGHNGYRVHYEEVSLVDGQLVYPLPSDPVVNTVTRVMSPWGDGLNLNDPFQRIVYNDIYTMATRGGFSSLNLGLLLMQFEQLGKYIPEIEFDHDKPGNQIVLVPGGAQSGKCLIECYVNLEDEEYRDIEWIIDWTAAEAKEALGLAYRKFQQLPGPMGQSSLSGGELVQEAKEEKEKLLEDIENFVDGDLDWSPVTFG